MRGSIAFWSLLALLVSPNVLGRPDFPVNAWVIAVIDGDTLLLKPMDPVEGQHFFKLRLADIDAPEKNQAFGVEATQALSKLVLHQRIRLVTVATDHYGRRVGWVTLVGPGLTQIDINAELVRRGWAWATGYRHHALLAPTQQEAQRARRGLWAAAHPVSPRLWRQQSTTYDRGNEANPAFANTPFPAPLHD